MIRSGVRPIVTVLWAILALSAIAPAQEILPPLDIAKTRQPSFVPGEIIVKFKAPAAGVNEARAFETVAFSDQLRPLGGGAFLFRLDPNLFTPQIAETQAVRTLRVAREFEKREDIISAQPGAPGEIITRPADAEAFKKAVAAREVETIVFEGPPRQLSGGRFALRLAAGVVSPAADQSLGERTVAALAELKKRADVEDAQLNYVLTHRQPPNDPAFTYQWNLFNNGTMPDESRGGINLLREWEYERGNAAVVVAVIDTGILADHPDLAHSDHLVPGFDMITKDGRAGDGASEPGRDANPHDEGDGVAAGGCGNGEPLLAEPDSWHGTHVAGIVGAGLTNNRLGIAAVNWEVKVQPIRVLGKCGGDIADINDAIRWAAGLPLLNTPPNPTPAKVINLSLGIALPCSEFPLTQAAIDDAHRAGVTIVAAAGNEAMDAAQSTPASCDHVIAVAASDARGHLVERYSNFGSRVDIMAPGGDLDRDDNGDQFEDGVLSTVKAGYRLQNGTSMAAPHVSGVAALLLAREARLSPGAVLTPDAILQRLRDNALPRTEAQCPKPCGAGLLNGFFPAHVPAAGADAAVGGGPSSPPPEP